MMLKSSFHTTVLLFLCLVSGLPMTGFGQDADDDDQLIPQGKTKFLTGLFVGGYFANNSTASAYSGYGFDAYGNRNLFANSLMYQKIKNEYGGGYGQYDYIADALGVDQKQWEFNESDMPINMHYVPAIMLGFNFKLPVTRNSAFVFNLNGAKLSVEGNFTINTLRPQGNVNPALNNNQHVFAIRGSEQRLLFQLGFQHVFGKMDKMNFFGELGLNGTLAKFDKNMIYINNLQIDLMYYVNQATFPSPYPYTKRVGFGMGAYAALGLNMELNPKFTVQLLYQPSHERVKIESSSSLKLQHAIGLRVYYKI